MKLFNKKKEQKVWLINIDSPVDRTGETYFDVYEGSKRVNVSNYKHLISLIKKHSPLVYSLNSKTQNMLNVFDLQSEIPKTDYNIR